MAELLKNYYNKTFIENVSEEVIKHYPSFDKNAFIVSVFNKNWELLELKQRMRHITNMLNEHMPVSYKKQVAVLQKAGSRFSGFTALVFPDFIETFGVHDPDVSIPALEFFTRFSSSEFAVRPFIVKYPERMLKQHEIWSKHKSHHVRRLASEGIRPRLPWGMALTAFKKDPHPLWVVLENLKQDESEYVRRSVANCLNDISKDHPELVLKKMKEWKGHSPETDWIIRHASRGLLRKGHAGALLAFNLNPNIRSKISSFSLSKNELKRNDEFVFSFKLSHHEKRTQKIRVEYKIYYQKANGSLSPKVFQVGTYEMKTGESKEMIRKHKFSDLTTRKHYPGKHRLAIVINGKEIHEVEFDLKV